MGLSPIIRFGKIIGLASLGVVAAIAGLGLIMVGARRLRVKLRSKQEVDKNEQNK